MKTVLLWLLGIAVAYIIFLILGLIGCLYDGSIGWKDGWFVALDPNGQIHQPVPQVKPTEEEIQHIEAEHQEFRANKAAWLCFAALGSFILGWIAGKAQFHTIGLCFLVGALAWDYKVLATAIFLWYIIIPAIVIMGIVGLFRRS